MGVEFPRRAGWSGFQNPETRGKVASNKEVEMRAIGSRPAVGEKSAVQKKSAPRPSDWFWRPWYAKLLWSCAGLYWICLYAVMLVPNDWLSSSMAGAMVVLVFLFNPISVIVILGRGFLKAKVACGDWVIVPGVPLEVAEWQKREREVAYINPVDIRSGYMHQDYLDGLTARPNDPAGL